MADPSSYEHVAGVEDVIASERLTAMESYFNLTAEADELTAQLARRVDAIDFVRHGLRPPIGTVINIVPNTLGIAKIKRVKKEAHDIVVAE